MAETPAPARPLDADEVFRIIRERLAEILEIDEGRVTLEASFAEDLSADSLALIELVEALEAELEDRTGGFRIEDEDLADLRTVRDAVEYVIERAG
jgi:acyl carrier protein